MSAAGQGRLVVMLQSRPDVEERNYSCSTQCIFLDKVFCIRGDISNITLNNYIKNTSPGICVARRV